MSCILPRELRFAGEVQIAHICRLILYKSTYAIVLGYRTSSTPEVPDRLGRQQPAESGLASCAQAQAAEVPGSFEPQAADRPAAVQLLRRSFGVRHSLACLAPPWACLVPQRARQPPQEIGLHAEELIRIPLILIHE